MKIGIYTIHACNNFGALLQAYATARFLNGHGREAELVNIVTAKAEQKMNFVGSWKSVKGIISNIFAMVMPSARKKKRNLKFFRTLMPLSRIYNSISDVEKTPPQYNINIVGSDQVWNIEKGIKNVFYFLPFLNEKAVKISYASSFGNIHNANDYIPQITNFLSSFKSVSVREKDAADFLTNSCNVYAKHVLDPTFLLDAEQWEELAGKTPIIESDYILYYGFDKGSFCKKALNILRNETRMPIIGVSVSLFTPYKFDRFYREAGPKEFLNLIKNAKLIITSSFHGLALSINFRKNVIVLKHGTRMSRMESLLETFCIKGRIVSSIEELNELLNNRYALVYDDETCRRINMLVEDSREWLLKNTQDNE